MLLLFLVPAGVMYGCIYVLWPYLTQLGIPAQNGYVYATSLTTGGMLVASLVGLVLEGHPLNWGSLKERFRLKKLDARGWLWTLVGLVSLLTISVLANFVLGTVYKTLSFTPPAVTPHIKDISLLLVMLVFNILGEEFWWRGFIQPRQELTFGNKTFIVHGGLWAFFHAFKWWAVPAMFVVCMVVPYITQRTKSTVPSLVLHLIQNGLGIIVVMMSR